jgi:hypothetical protein
MQADATLKGEKRAEGREKRPQQQNVLLQSRAKQTLDARPMIPKSRDNGGEDPGELGSRDGEIEFGFKKLKRKKMAKSEKPQRRRWPVATSVIQSDKVQAGRALQ